MNWKVVVVVLILGVVAYFGYRQWSGTRAALEVFCDRMIECSSPADFADKYGDREGCVDSELAERELEEFDGCDPTEDCHDWLVCGFGSRTGDRRDPNHKTNFEEVLPHL